MSDEIVWADELPPQTGRPLLEFAERLRANPGKWGRYPHEYVKGGASSAQANAAANYPHIEWERRGNFIWGRYKP